MKVGPCAGLHELAMVVGQCVGIGMEVWLECGLWVWLAWLLKLAMVVGQCVWVWRGGVAYMWLCNLQASM
eukprot:1160202-Pelagomonas_calceolata.AAC.6